MKTVSGLDGAFLHMETPETPQHVGSLSRYALPPGYKGDFYDDFRREMAKRLHLVPVFTRKLAPMPLQFANPISNSKSMEFSGFANQQKSDSRLGCSFCPPFCPS